MHSKGFQEDKCQLYLFRMAIYYAENTVWEEEKLKWWYWKDKEYPEKWNVWNRYLTIIVNNRELIYVYIWIIKQKKNWENYSFLEFYDNINREKIKKNLI